MKLNKNIKKILSNQLFLNKLSFFALVLLTLASALFLYDNPTFASGSLLFFSVYMIPQNYFENKIYNSSRGLKVEEVMIPKSALMSLTHATDVSKAIELIGRSYQQVFPVYFNDNFLGIINRDKFIASFGIKTNFDYIADFIQKKYDYIYGDEALEKTLLSGNLKNAGNLVVLDHDHQFIGLLSYDKLVEYLLIEKVFKETKDRELQDEFWL